MCNLYNNQQLFIYWLFSFWIKKLSGLPIFYGGFFNNEDRNYDKTLGIGIPDLLINLMSCHGFLKNKNPIVILKCPKSMFEYYLSKGFTYFI